MELRRAAYYEKDITAITCWRERRVIDRQFDSGRVSVSESHGAWQDKP